MRHSAGGSAMQLSGSRCSVSSLESAAESIARSTSPNRCAKIVLCEPNGTENFFSISLTTPERSGKADGKPVFCDWRDWESNLTRMSIVYRETWESTGQGENKPAKQAQVCTYHGKIH